MKKILRNILLLTFLTFNPYSMTVGNSSMENYFKKEKYFNIIRGCLNKVAEINYLNDENDYWQNPKETIKKGTGDCEDKAIYFKSLIDRKGIGSKLVFGKLSEKDKSNHVWNEIDIGEKTYVIESANKGKIFDKDSLEKINEFYSYKGKKGIKYLFSKDFKYLEGEINGYEKRNRVRLEFKGHKDWKSILSNNL